MFQTGLSEKKVTFSDSTQEHGSGGQTVLNGGRQMVPGLLVLPDSKRNYSSLKSQ